MSQPDHVLVLQNSGPIGGPGMPEVGNLPIPQKLLKQGVRDMLRISDARMSGTSYGTIVLHVAPEAALGGPLALVRDGDEIELNVEARRLHLHVSEAELAERRAKWSPPEPAFTRGYGQLYLQHVNQAPLGVDFDFLRGGDPVTVRASSRSFDLIEWAGLISLDKLGYIGETILKHITPRTGSRQWQSKRVWTRIWRRKLQVEMLNA